MAQIIVHNKAFIWIYHSWTQVNFLFLKGICNLSWIVGRNIIFLTTKKHLISCCVVLVNWDILIEIISNTPDIKITSIHHGCKWVCQDSMTDSFLENLGLLFKFYWGVSSQSLWPAGGKQCVCLFIGDLAWLPALLADRNTTDHFIWKSLAGAICVFEK